MQETTVRRTTTPVERRHDGCGSHDETDWRHEETVTVRRVRRVPASAAQQHFGDAAIAAGPGVRTGERRDVMGAAAIWARIPTVIFQGLAMFLTLQLECNLYAFA